MLQKGDFMISENLSTLTQIHNSAKAEFLQKGYQSASLRNIVKSVGMTTGAFYGYYKSKEDLFEALVKEQYDFVVNCIKSATSEFESFPYEKQLELMSDFSGQCMDDILIYMCNHIDEFKLILCCSEGTRFSKMIDDLVEIEIESTKKFKEVLLKLGHECPHIDPVLEHILCTGMFHTFFELVIHDMPLEDAKIYVKEMRDFYNAGWIKIMGL